MHILLHRWLKKKRGRKFTGMQEAVITCPASSMGGSSKIMQIFGYLHNMESAIMFLLVRTRVGSKNVFAQISSNITFRRKGTFQYFVKFFVKKIKN